MNTTTALKTALAAQFLNLDDLAPFEIEALLADMEFATDEGHDLTEAATNAVEAFLEGDLDL